jgi:hypothetical protein
MFSIIKYFYKLYLQENKAQINPLSTIDLSAQPPLWFYVMPQLCYLWHNRHQKWLENAPIPLLSFPCRSTKAQINPQSTIDLSTLLPFYVVGNEGGFFPQIQPPMTTLQVLGGGGAVRSMF